MKKRNIVQKEYSYNKYCLILSISLFSFIGCTNIKSNTQNQSIKQRNDTISNSDGTYSINGVTISPPESGDTSYSDLQFKYYYHDLTMKEAENNLPLIESGLEKMNFKFPSYSKYLERIKDVFNIDLSFVNNNYFVSKGDYIAFMYNSPGYNKFSEDEDPELKFSFAMVNSQSIFFKKGKNYILNLSYTASFINIDTFEVNQKVIPQLPPKLFHINNYIFNESKSSLTWLMLNETSFVQSLFIDLGYTADKKLDQWVLDNRLNNETIYDFGKAFYYKRFDNTVKFNPEVFEVFEEKANPKYMKQLKHLFTSSNFRDEYNLTFEQKAELFARLMYSAEDVAYKNQTVKIVTKEYPYYPDSFRQYIGSFTGTFKQYIDENGKYYQEFKRNNFYNLPNFEEYWQAGEDFIEMMTPPQREVEEG